MTDDEIKEVIDHFRAAGNIRVVAAIEHLLRERDEKKRVYGELVDDVRAARSEAYEQGRESAEAENARLRKCLENAEGWLQHETAQASKNALVHIRAALKGGKE